MEYSQPFEYETKGGYCIPMTAVLDVTAESGCVSCEWPGCQHCPSTLELNGISFLRDFGKTMTKRQEAAANRYYNDTNLKDHGIEEAGEIINAEPDAD